MTGRVQQLRRLRSTLVEYMLAKIVDEDWHAVSDAVTDLREIDAELRGIEEGMR